MEGSWEDEYNEELEDEDSQEFGDSLEASKDQIIFLIDASERMFEGFVPREENGVSNSYFSSSLEMVKLYLKVKIFSNPTDEFAVLFYGTKKSSNDSSLDNVWTFLNLDLTDASRIRQIDELQDDDFKELIGSMEEGPMRTEALRMGLWAAGQILMNKSKSNKQVLLITRDDNPCGAVAASRNNAVARAEELKYAQISLQLIPLPTPGQLFDMSKFWQSLLLASMPEDSQQDIASDFAYLKEFAAMQSFTGADLESVTSSLNNLVRKKAHRRRAVSKLKWTLVEGTTIAVQVYNLVQPCPKPVGINVHSISNALLRQERRFLHSETGQVLTEQDKVTVFQPAKNVPPDIFPQYVRMSRDIVAAVKNVAEPGLKLLGFKPRAHLRDFHQAGHSSFLRPNEAQVRGSVTAFKALLDAMLREDKIAICRYRRGKSSDTRLVALLPQVEVQDELHIQVFPEGMHLIQLPFVDDIRCPEQEASVIGPQVYRADAEQVRLASAMIDALTFPKDDATGESNFDCCSVSNPFLQRAYDAIELRAMDREIPPIVANPEWDATLPDIDSIEKQHDRVTEYKDSVWGLDAKVDGAKGAKRKTSEATPADAAYANFDWQELVNKSGLKGLIIKDLKVYLQHNRLKLSGNKDELIARIQDHFRGAQGV